MSFSLVKMDGLIRLHGITLFCAILLGIAGKAICLDGPGAEGGDLALPLLLSDTVAAINADEYAKKKTSALSDGFYGAPTDYPSADGSSSATGDVENRILERLLDRKLTASLVSANFNAGNIRALPFVTRFVIYKSLISKRFHGNVLDVTNHVLTQLEANCKSRLLEDFAYAVWASAVILEGYYDSDAVSAADVKVMIARITEVKRVVSLDVKKENDFASALLDASIVTLGNLSNQIDAVKGGRVRSEGNRLLADY